VRMDLGIAGSDFDNHEMHRSYPIGMPSPQDDATLLHRYCYRQGIACGFIHPEDDLSKLKALYVPHWLKWSDAWTARIEAFAKAGGTVILGARTGSRDVNNHVIRNTAPGKALSALAGVTVEEFGRLTPVGGDGLFVHGGRFDSKTVHQKLPATSASRQYELKIGNARLTAAHLYELLKVAPGTEVIGIWASRFAEGRAAMTSRKIGQGNVIYLGTYLSDALAAVLADQVLAPAGIVPLVADMPTGVEATIRESKDRRLLFILNTLGEPADVPNIPKGNDLLGDARVRAGRMRLPAYGCSIIELAWSA
jgi:beta-galactosidase